MKLKISSFISCFIQSSILVVIEPDEIVSCIYEQIEINFMTSVMFYHYPHPVFILCSITLSEGDLLLERHCHGMLIRLIRGGNWFPYHCGDRKNSYHVHLLVTSFKYCIELVLKVIALVLSVVLVYGLTFTAEYSNP